MIELDQWILVRAEDLVRRCRAWYDEFAFHKIYHAVYDVATVDLSSIYFDVLKDRLYTSATRSKQRRSAQTAIHRVTYALVRLLAPLLAFTAEEVWKHLKQPGSVHTALFPEPEELTSGLSADSRKRVANWDRLMDVREDVLKSLETARQEKFIGAPLEARVNLSANGDLYPLLEQYAQDLPSLFIVSQVSLNNGEALSVRIERADGSKCQRCWKYTTDVGASAEFPTICGSCVTAVKEALEN
jgi:isoleucyl-tRNA synthetase